MAGAAARSQPETPPPAVEARDRRGRCRRPCKPRIGHRRDLPRRGCAPAATSTGERVVRPAGRRPRAAHSRRGAQATPARTVRWFQCVRPAATRWPHRFLRVPDTARVVHQDKWCRAPTRLEHCRTAAPATPPSGQQRAPDPRQHAPVRTAPVRPRHIPCTSRRVGPPSPVMESSQLTWSKSGFPRHHHVPEPVHQGPDTRRYARARTPVDGRPCGTHHRRSAVRVGDDRAHPDRLGWTRRATSRGRWEASIPRRGRVWRFKRVLG